MDRGAPSRKRTSDCSPNRYNLRNKSISMAPEDRPHKRVPFAVQGNEMSGCRLGSVNKVGNRANILSLGSEPSKCRTNDANINRERGLSSKSVTTSPSIRSETEFVSGSSKSREGNVESATATYTMANFPKGVIWCGSFKVVDCGKVRMCEGIIGCPSAVISSKASKFSEKIDPVLHLKLHPRTDFYPNIFQDVCPDTDDIAIYFFRSTYYDMSIQQYEDLLNDMIEKDLMLRSHVAGREFLVFPSSVLRMDCQKRDDNSYFMWGVFGREKQAKYWSNKEAHSKNRLKVMV